MLTAEDLIRRLGLQPLPVEGGYFTQSYVSAESVPAEALPPRYGSPRPFSTAIYYLLTSDADSFSALHRLATDEVYHFYLGDPVELLLLRADGSGEVITIGTGLDQGMRPQIMVPRGTWQGSRLKPGGSFALLGTTMAPGFEFADFELAPRDHLLASHPAYSAMILQLTR